MKAPVLIGIILLILQACGLPAIQSQLVVSGDDGIQFTGQITFTSAGKSRTSRVAGPNPAIFGSLLIASVDGINARLVKTANDNRTLKVTCLVNGLERETKETKDSYGEILISCNR